ncbi:MAG: DNA polymerase IV [Actinomycetota bacterium]|nr:DNA polymerase IV [Actinomycetota bacterium]
MGDWVLHVDLDQFVAAVEVLRDPSLAGRPVVVGGRGDATLRGVVSTASYEARTFGVGSGMPLRTAARKLPDDAVFLPVDGPLYAGASQQVMDVLRSFGETDGAVVEVLGWDEAFIGVVTDDPQSLARRIQATVLERTRLHCSIGIGQTKVMAKTATSFGKPQGVFAITADTWFEIMGSRPTDALWGVGRKTSVKLDALGFTTVSQLATAPIEPLVARLGPTMGPWYRRIARGGDLSPVTSTPWVARGHGRETTFQENLCDWEQVEQEVRALAYRVLEDVVAEGRPAVRVGLKVRYAPFESHTASTPLPEPTFAELEIADAAAALLARFDATRAVRLLGVRLEMSPPEGGYPR